MLPACVGVGVVVSWEQEGSGGIGDADVEPPSRGARGDQEDLGEVRRERKHDSRTVVQELKSDVRVQRFLLWKSFPRESERAVLLLLLLLPMYWYAQVVPVTLFRTLVRTMPLPSWKRKG